MKLIWSKQAIAALKEHHDHIKADSATAAKTVKSQIIEASKGLSTFPERFELDEYYPDNPGNIRRFFKWSFRIVYQVSDDSVDILNVLHTSQQPNPKN
jgi:plasmid stabilization system protein ParE